LGWNLSRGWFVGGAAGETMGDVTMGTGGPVTGLFQREYTPLVRLRIRLSNHARRGSDPSNRFRATQTKPRSPPTTPPAPSSPTTNSDPSAPTTPTGTTAWPAPPSPANSAARYAHPPCASPTNTPKCSPPPSTHPGAAANRPSPSRPTSTSTPTPGKNTTTSPPPTDTPTTDAPPSNAPTHASRPRHHQHRQPTESWKGGTGSCRSCVDSAADLPVRDEGCPGWSIRAHGFAGVREHFVSMALPPAVTKGGAGSSDGASGHDPLLGGAPHRGDPLEVFVVVEDDQPGVFSPAAITSSGIGTRCWPIRASSCWRSMAVAMTAGVMGAASKARRSSSTSW
jgi:hypothetical protein